MRGGSLVAVFLFLFISFHLVVLVVITPVVHEILKSRKAGLEPFDSFSGDLSPFNVQFLKRRHLQEVDDPFVPNASALQAQLLEAGHGRQVGKACPSYPSETEIQGLHVD